ncbi:MAG: dethiobiotin synthase [Phenylobacterium sp.]|uniref:dethiobiotin synthase n=1 Tax=Phenylobacterium sp. TaxID=1871053 RepID=UPI003BB4D61C
MRALFIAGAHTDVGKTWAACAILKAARAQGLTVAALKPVVTGYLPSVATDMSDPGRLLAALGRDLSADALEAMSPLRFEAALSPPMAARLEGVTLTLADLLAVCRPVLERQTADLLLVEGAGGVMSPMAQDATGLDLQLALGLPTILVGGAYLGGVSHTLTALEVLRSRGLAVLGVVVSQSADPDAPDFPQTVAAIAGFAGEVPVLAAPRDDETWASALL